MYTLYNIYVCVLIYAKVNMYFLNLQVFEEKTYLVGVECKGSGKDSFGIEESLDELAQLADTAGLLVVGSTYQK